MPYDRTTRLIGTTAYFKKETTAGTPIVPVAADGFRHGGISMTSQAQSLPIVEYGADNDPQKASVYRSNYQVSVRTTVRPPKTANGIPGADAMLENFFGKVTPASQQGNKRTYTLEGDNSITGTLIQDSNISQEAAVGVVLATLGFTWSANNYVFMDFAGFSQSLGVFSPFDAGFDTGKLSEVKPPSGVDIRTLISGPGPVIKKGTGAAQQVTAVDGTKATLRGDLAGANPVGSNPLLSGLVDDDGDAIATYRDSADESPATGLQGLIVFGPAGGTEPDITSTNDYEDDVASGEVGRVAVQTGSLSLNSGRFIDFSEWGEDATYPTAYGPRESTFQFTSAITKQVERMLAAVEINQSYSVSLRLGLTSGVHIRLIMPEVTLAGSRNPPPAPGSRGTPTATFNGRLSVPSGQDNKEARLVIEG